MNELASNLDPNILRATLMAGQSLPPGKVDAIFLHGRAPGDDTGLMEHSAFIHRHGLADLIVIIGNEGQRFGSTTPYEANPGMTYYTSRLVALGIPRNDLCYTRENPDGTGFNTRTESDALIELAKERGWTTAVAPTHPHQTLRALAGSVRAMNSADYRMGLWYVSPFVTQWEEIVPGSQGLDPKPRKLHIQDELERIPKYISSGSIASPEQVVEYLKWRDQTYPTKGSAQFYYSLLSLV